MKLLAAGFTALTLFLVTTSTRAAEPDTPEARARLVDEYFEYVPMKTILSEVVLEVAKQIPEDKRQVFVDALTKNMRIEVIASAARQSLEKHLTLAELEMFVEFIKKPEAQSAMDKMKYYMADLMPVMRQELVRAMQLTAPPAQK